MANRPAIVRQVDLTRYLKAATAAGVPVARIDVRPDGTVRLYTSPAPADDASNPWDAYS